MSSMSASPSPEPSAGSGTARTASLTVTTWLPSTTLTLLDHQDVPVATGTGALRLTDVAPGLYRVQVEAGESTTERMLALRPGEHVDEHVELLLPLATPVKAAATHHAEHAQVASQLSLQPQLGLGVGGRLVVMARVVDPDAPLESVDAIGLELLEATQGTPVLPGLPWQVGPGWSGVSLDVDPGTYLLSTTDDPAGPVQQTVVVPEGWTCLVFLPAAREDEGSPATPHPSRAAVHLVRLGTGFEPYDFGSDAAFAAELALDGLRRGELLLPEGGWATVREVLPQDPMLGVYALHAALSAPQPDLTGLADPWQDLRELLPDHPDVIALTYPLAGVGSSGTVHHEPSLVVPPMLRSSYALLLSADLAQPTVLADGSLAEQVAGRLVMDGVWARWQVERSAERVLVPMTAEDWDEASRSVSRLEGAPVRAEQPEVVLPPAPPPAPPSVAPPGADAPLRAPRWQRWRRSHNLDRYLRADDTASVPAPPRVPTPPPGGPTLVPTDVARVADALARLQATHDPETEAAPTVADVSRVVGLPVSTVRASLEYLQR